MKKMMKYFVRTAVTLLVMACCVIPSYALDKSFYADTSKLASGKWVKIAVKESGIYQITADDIRSWGLGSDLSQIHVFGYGGAPLSEQMSGDNYADDLPQMPIVRTDSRILFYAQGPTTWKRYNALVPHMQIQHPYANSGSYFVTNDSRFSDIEIPRADNSPSGDVVTTYVERLFHEQDLVNPGETGRVFLGESFLTSKSQTFKFTLDGLSDERRVNVLSEFAAQAQGAKSTVSLSYNGELLPVGDNDLVGECVELNHEHYYSCQSVKSFDLEGTNELNYTVNYSCPGTVHLARLNYITVNYVRNMTLQNGSLLMGLSEAKPTLRYRVTGCGSDTRVWVVTKPFKPVQLNAESDGSALIFSPESNGRREVVVFDAAGTYAHPELSGNVKNQNIHSEATPDMIILAPSAYLEQASRVADLHEKVDKFRVLVLDQEKVFNEFSSGTQDAMAYRRLCKMFYDRGMSEDGHRLGYLLLMGCGSYDNRMIGANTDALNYPHLLTWQSNNSNHESDTYTSDDYFGILSDGSGIGDSEKMNISVGRMIVKSVSEARTVVNKLEKYVTKPYFGAWKNQVLMAADDENSGSHMLQSMEMIANARKNGGKDMVYNYLFIDAFNAVSQGGSRSYPDARTKMFNLLNEGVLWWNYLGHASTQNWTGEGLLTRTDVETNLYYRHLPVLYAATCEFCRFDNSILSSGERIFLNANGGAIAVICPPRLARIGDNGELSAKVGKYIFTSDEEGRPLRIGDILRRAKNELNPIISNNRRFFVFGDPAMRLAYASYTAQIETINGKPIDSGNKPVFKAREQVEFGGKILDWNGDLAINFNGAIVSTLFGPEQSVTTHGYYSDPKHPEYGVKVTYEDRPDRLAITVDTVEGGQFKVRMIIPSEVDNEYGNYRPSLINLYAYDSSEKLEAKGSNSDFYIYGYEMEEVTDTIGPEIISMGLNDENFVNGSDVNESPLFLATVTDKSGVNFSSAGVGHSMTLTLDGTTSYNDLVGYYTPMYIEEGTLGSISYQLSDLSPGQHTLRLRVWDVYNNVNERTINFNVIKGLAPDITDVYCTTNPASAETSFYVKHNRPDAVVAVTIEVYDLMGRKVWSTTQSGRSDMYTSIPVTWDLTDMGGRRVPRGIYVYRATISTDGVKEATKAKKLAVTSE